jgi:peptide methionine sulfoxide reductase msrA/msrB
MTQWQGRWLVKYKSVSKFRIMFWAGLTILPLVIIVPLTMRARENTAVKTMTHNKLTPEEQRVIVDKGTEMPFTGKYDNFWEAGTYYCKQCGAALFRSKDKFDAGCGWPSFDDAIPGAVKRTLDADGMREEITCANCGAHLGHVFTGEQFTAKDERYCVNSISMNFVAADSEVTTQKAYFAGGCFWGTEYLLEKADGVISTRVGYMGGRTKNPTYQDVCSDTTGHAETVEVIFDPKKTSYEKLSRLFFEIHDPTQVDRQGPDVGDQYRSEIFYVDDAQKQMAEKLVTILKAKGYNVATQLAKADTFWPAESYHQKYYDHTGKQPYCHAYTKRF